MIRLNSLVHWKAQRKIHWKIQSLLVFSFLCAQSSFALVDARNANYLTTAKDFEAGGSGFPLQILRSYNSRSLYSGYFGFGMCSDFETILEVRPESRPVVIECGSGQKTVYSPRDFNPKKIEESNAKIVSAMKAAGKDEKYIQSISKQLAQDDDLRSTLANEYKLKVEIPEGVKMFANGVESENLIFAKGVYTRSLADGSSQQFNKQGQLTHLYDKNGNFIRLDYDKGTLKEVVDNLGRRLRFTFLNGKVVKVIAPNNISIEYTYKNNEDLISVNNAWGNKFTYEYDDLHNMTKASFPDKTSVSLQYDKKNDWVVGFTDRNGCQEKYNYEFDPKTPELHYWAVIKKTCKDEVTVEARHEFWYKKAVTGQSILERVASTVNGSKTEIVYHEAFNRPVSITKGSTTNRFTYYPNGLVRTKESPLGTLTYTYDPKTLKVTKVVAVSLNDKKTPINTKTTSYRWDQKGNLIFAENSDGQKVAIANDERGRMVRVEDQAKKIITLKYDEKSNLPASINRPGFGVVNLKYKANGEMDKVESPQGASAALQIVMTFRSYMDLTMPASAELYN